MFLSASSPSFDYEQWLRDHSRPAAKRLADLHIGEPRTVRMIYFLPNDRPYQAGVVDSMKTMIGQLQTFYAEQSKTYGHGEKTFRFETDGQTGPLVHRVDGQNPDSHYLDNTFEIVLEEIGQVFDLEKNVYFVVIDNSLHAITVEEGGTPVDGGATSTGNGGMALVAEEFGFSIVAHELTHAFGLTWHDFRDESYILSYGPDPDRLSEGSVGFLAVHPYFNPDREPRAATPPAIERVSPDRYPFGSESVSVELRLRDSDGLHQVFLFVTTGWLHQAAGSLEVKAYRTMAGEEEAVVALDYDGSTPSNVRTSLSNPKVHSMDVAVVDVDGNTAWASFELRELSQQHIATFSAADAIVSLLFSSDGTLLAGTTNGIAAWDVETRQALRRIEGTGSDILTMGFTSDGKIVSGSADGTIELWDRESRLGTLLQVVPDFLHTVALSPDGTSVASGSQDGTIRLWDIESQTQTADLEGHDQPVLALSFSSDGTLLASGSQDGTIRLWDIESQTQTADLEGHDQPVLALSFSADGTLLASGSQDGTVKLWDISSHSEYRHLPGHGAGVTSVAFSPAGEALASGSRDQHVKLWDVILGEETFTLSGHSGEVTSVVFSPDGATLASGGWDNTILLWDVSERKRPLPLTLVKISGDSQEGPAGSDLADPFVVEVQDQYGQPLPGVRVTFSIREGGGKIGGRSIEEIVVTNADGLARSTLTLGPNSGENSVEAAVEGLEPLTFDSWGVGTSETLTDYQTWHLPEGARARLGKGRLSQGERAIAFSPGGGRFALLSSIGVWLYDVATFRPLALLPTGYSEHGSLAFSPDGQSLVSSPTDEDALLKLWTLETGEIAATLSADLSSPPVFSPDGTTVAFGSWDNTIKLWEVATGETTVLEGHTDGVSALEFSPDGSLLASGAWDNEMRIWDLETGETAVTLQGHDDVVNSVAFSLEASLLASASADGTLRLWDVEAGTHTATLERVGVYIESVSFSAEGILASGAADGTVKLWNVATGERTALLEGHTGEVSSVAFSPDGALASVSWSDGTVKLWNPATREAATLEGHSDDVHTLAVSPDGRTLASAAGYERIVKLWDLETRVRSGSLDGHEWVVQSLAFLPDGTLASGSGDGTIRLWDMETGDSATLGEGLGWVYSLAISPDDGATLASGSMNGMVKLWDVASGTDLTLEGHTNNVSTVAFSPSDGLLASGSWDRTVRLWDAATGTHSATLEEHSGWVHSVAFSPDGQTLASGGDDISVRLWDVASRKASVLEGHTDGVTSVAYSPDGTLLASGSRDRTVRIWEPDRGDENPLMATFEQGFWINSVAFSPDGTILASGGGDGTVLLWDMQRLLLRPHSLGKVSGDRQEGPPGMVAEPLVVEVWDQNEDLFAGATVTFAVTAGGGTLSAATVSTDANGRASSTLTLGRLPETNTVTVTVEGLEPVTFTAVAKATPDFDGDGETGFSDFFLFADAFGGSDPRFDLDGSGSVDFADFFLLADHFGDPARGKLLALARELIGLPDGPQLQQNAPNPFNSQTVITWFQLPGPGRVEVFALTGQRVATLHQGATKAGIHRVHWDGLDDQGRALASGVYLYRLVTAQSVQKRKLTLLR